MKYDALLREIRSKRAVLAHRGPFSAAAKAQVEALEAGTWIRMHLRLEGSSLTEADLRALSEGGFVRTATVHEHLLLQRLPQLRAFIYRLNDSGAALSMQILSDMQGIVTGASGRIPYREPAVEEELAALIRLSRAESAESLSALLERAATIHDRIRQIDPYGDGGALLGRAAMYYWLVGQGQPMAALLWDRDTYEEAYQRFETSGDSLALAAGLGQAILLRIEQMIAIQDSGV